VVVSLDGFTTDDDGVGPLFDQVAVNQVPVVFGSGRPFFATGGLAEPLRSENPTTIVCGDRVTHLVYDVRPSHAA
jgi:hypothetical protein